MITILHKKVIPGKTKAELKAEYKKIERKIKKDKINFKRFDLGRK